MKTRIRYFLFLALGVVLTAFLLAACPGPNPPTPPPGTPISWNLAPVTTFTAPGASATYQLLQIGEIDGIVLPGFNSKKAFDLLIMGAGSCQGVSSTSCEHYGNKPLNEFYDDVKLFMRNVFGEPNELGKTPSDRLFNYYVTDYEYSQATPQGGLCDPGLPQGWVPKQNVTYDGPAFGCNIALSTAAPRLNLGFIVHGGNIQDRNRHNLFSAEYNSYAAILHELSHAAFVMADEAPTGQGRWFPKKYPNLYKNAYCEDPQGVAVCSGQCVQVTRIYYHCSSGATGDDTNLTYFATPVSPGVNSGWQTYQYQFDAIKRLHNYMYEELCMKGKC